MVDVDEARVVAVDSIGSVVSALDDVIAEVNVGVLLVCTVEVVF